VCPIEALVVAGEAMHEKYHKRKNLSSLSKSLLGFAGANSGSLFFLLFSGCLAGGVAHVNGWGVVVVVGLQVEADGFSHR
jgi:hypothetical protein